MIIPASINSAKSQNMSALTSARPIPGKAPRSWNTREAGSIECGRFGARDGAALQDSVAALFLESHESRAISSVEVAAVGQGHPTVDLREEDLQRLSRAVGCPESEAV
jgi:hypothetical protein